MSGCTGSHYHTGVSQDGATAAGDGSCPWSGPSALMLLSTIAFPKKSKRVHEVMNPQISSSVFDHGPKDAEKTRLLFGTKLTKACFR